LLRKPEVEADLTPITGGLDTETPVISAPADVSDVLVKVLAEHHIAPLAPDRICQCGHDSEVDFVKDMVRAHDAHVAACLSERFVITPRENT
jgi:hypothetical protein